MEITKVYFIRSPSQGNHSTAISHLLRNTVIFSPNEPNSNFLRSPNQNLHEVIIESNWFVPFGANLAKFRPKADMTGITGVCWTAKHLDLTFSDVRINQPLCYCYKAKRLTGRFVHWTSLDLGLTFTMLWKKYYKYHSIEISIQLIDLSKRKKNSKLKVMLYIIFLL